MILVVQPELVEQTVFGALRAVPAELAEYQRQFAKCHEAGDEQRREGAFRELHERWFNRLGYRELILGLVHEFPQVRGKVDRLVIALAPGPRAQSSELFGAPGRYTAALAVCSLLDRGAFAYWARHEFLHIDDMLDPAFEFDRGLQAEGSTGLRRILARERYALLWAMSVDARLSRRVGIPAAIMPCRRREFARAFRVSCGPAADEAFDRLWSSFADQRPTHPALLASANEGLLTGTGCEEAEEHAPPPAGSPCPICRFPTFDWASAERLREVAGLLRADFADWMPGDGICRRCAELYHARAQSPTRPAVCGASVV